MNRLAIAAILTLVTSAAAFTGCSKSAEDKLVGTWEADMSTFEMEALAEMPEGQRAEIMEMLATGAMELTNNSDGTYSTFNRNPINGEEYTETGTWEVLSTDGDTITVRTTELTDTRGEEEIDEEPEEVELQLVDNDTILMMDEDEGGGSITVQMNRQ